MSIERNHPTTPLCWTLTQGSAGMESQVIGLAEALGFPVVSKIAERRYPWRLLWAGLSWKALRQLKPTSDLLASPWPDILITCGRGAVPLALAIRKQSGGKTFCIHIQDPHIDPARFDVVIVPSHDAIQGPNVIQTEGAPHRLTRQKLEQARAQFLPRFASFTPPLFVVLIGGSGNSYRLTRRRTRRLLNELDTILGAFSGTLLITPSRRTGDDNIALIQDHFKNSPRVFVADLKVENPYMGMLSLADTLFVTEDSVSMISEASYTGKPVYILRLDGYSRRKHKAFINNLQARGIIRYFKDQVESWKYSPLDETHRVAEEIKAKFYEHLEKVG